MKANLPTAEPKLLDRWESSGVYDQIRESRKGRPTYVLHDGPPYANGDMHIGLAAIDWRRSYILPVSWLSTSCCSKLHTAGLRS